MNGLFGELKEDLHLDGLYTTVVGYAGGHTNDPNYEKVCTGTTGHAEAVKVIYDEKNNLNDLLKFFRGHITPPNLIDKVMIWEHNMGL